MTGSRWSVDMTGRAEDVFGVMVRLRILLDLEKRLLLQVGLVFLRVLL